MDLETIAGFSSWNWANWLAIIIFFIASVSSIYLFYNYSRVVDEKNIKVELRRKQTGNESVVSYEYGLDSPSSIKLSNVLLQCRYAVMNGAREVASGSARYKLDYVYSGTFNHLGEFSTEFGRFTEILFDCDVVGYDIRPKGFHYKIQIDINKNLILNNA